MWNVIKLFNIIFYIFFLKIPIIIWCLITIHNRWLSVNYGTSKKRKLKKKKKKWNNRAFFLKTIHWNKRYNGPSAQLKSPHKTTVRPNQRKRLSKKREEKEKRELLQYNNMAPSCVIECLFDWEWNFIFLLLLGRYHAFNFHPLSYYFIIIIIN